ncbi:hypothetical protein KR093_011053 [Drosophila rubida]|uniref:Uncharacterized protein n=1 Tax=Drosophila rubida TaxID=30044 RepID=A0AAD4PME8_9MUSC|nr:hypothetical protein KR093_005826 [Drosophila rubida]KAH8373126.1 hypothetical protein KR093_011053 [Drosophila rubida]
MEVCENQQKIDKAEKKRQKRLRKEMKAKHHHDKLKKHSHKMLKSTQHINFPYQIFLHRKELRKSVKDLSYLRLSRSKIMLTAYLIAKNIDNVNSMCTADDLKQLSREVKYKKGLIDRVERLAQF